MNKEEILEMSRKENQKRDEMERQTFYKAGQLASSVGGILCGFIIILEAIFSDHVSLSIWVIYLSMTGTMLLSKYIYQKKKHELVFGVLELILAAIFLVMYIISLVR
ncbi:MAG: hypothetical protein IIZ39_06020 [Blautia sp.]|nr:hypothetical protein [Blautia sp.]